MLDALYRPRSLPVLLVVSFALASLLALWALPVGFILGTGAFWDAPSSIPFRGPPYDITQGLVGYIAFQRMPWGWPLLHVPTLVPPDGLNIFWLDAQPLVALLGKIAFSLTGVPVNLLGVFGFSCLVLPGVAMTCVLAQAGQRHVAGALAATVLAVAAPIMWFRWGNLSQQAHFLVIFALALYLPGRRGERPLHYALLWFVLLTSAALVNFYLFAMAGGIWVATLAQRVFDRRPTLPAVIVEAVGIVSGVAVILWVMGVLGAELGHSGTPGFGLYSMNLASPFVPQFSGVFPWLAQVRIGMPYQFEGFAYLGFGMLLVLSFSLRHIIAWLKADGRAHLALVLVLLGFVLFALSHRVYLGTTALVELPLPDHWVAFLGTYRSSGRFFWPITYALTAAGLVLILRNLSPRLSFRVLVIACLLQLIDIQPLRQALAASAAQGRADTTQRARIGELVRASHGVRVYPSWYCIEEEMEAGRIPFERRDEIHLPDLDIQLAAARSGRSTNSVYVARIPTDCAAERRMQAEPLRPGIAYFYRLGFTPDPAQLAGAMPADRCQVVGAMTYCAVP